MAARRATTLQKWLRGLVGATINSAAGSTAIVVVDPGDFDPLSGGAIKLAKVAIALGLIGAGLYLKEHKLPGCDDGDDDDAPSAA
ncbi:MAG: hypothetical protein ABL982_00110 [Vicinamibacterales bacterium]